MYPALAVSFRRKFAEIRSASPSATATLASAEPAASLARRQAFLASPWSSKAVARSLSGLETKAQDSSSLSALNAGQRSSTSRKGMNDTSPFPWGHSRTHTFQSRPSRSTRSANIPGSLLPTMSSTTGVTRSGSTPRSTRVSECAGGQGDLAASCTVCASGDASVTERLAAEMYAVA